MSTLNIVGLNILSRKLFKYSRKIKNERKQLFTRLAILGFKDVQQHFRDEVGRNRRVWQSLSPVTLSRRKKKGKGAKILQDTGNLKNSLMPHTGKKKYKFDSVVLSTDIKYAAIHNFGKKMPKREFMYLSRNGKLKIKKQINKFIKWI